MDGNTDYNTKLVQNLITAKGYNECKFFEYLKTQKGKITLT